MPCAFNQRRVLLYAMAMSNAGYLHVPTLFDRCPPLRRCCPISHMKNSEHHFCRSQRTCRDECATAITSIRSVMSNASCRIELLGCRLAFQEGVRLGDNASLHVESAAGWGKKLFHLPHRCLCSIIPNYNTKRTMIYAHHFIHPQVQNSGSQ